MGQYTGFHRRTEAKCDFGRKWSRFLSVPLLNESFKKQNYDGVWCNSSELIFPVQEESRVSGSEAMKEVAMEKLNAI